MRAAGVIETARPSEWEGMTPAYERGGLTVTIACSRCGDVGSYHHAERPCAPELACAKMKRRGWRLGKKALCPNCQRKPMAALEALLPETGSGDMAITEIEPSQAAKRARLDAIDLLRDNFDAATGSYRQGSSDAQIAEVTGLAVEAVAALRKEFFGDIKEPPVIAELRALLVSANAGAETALATAKAAVRDAETALEVVRQAGSNLAGVLAKQGWA